MKIKNRGMKNNSKIILIGIIALTIQYSLAQNTVGNDEVIVIKEHEAKVKDAVKIELMPVSPVIDIKKPTLNYTVPPKEFKELPFEPNPLKPIAISKEKLNKYNTSYLKLGFGSQLTPLVDFAYNDNKTKNLEFGLFYKHLSQYAFKIKNQRYSIDAPGFYLRYFPKTYEIGTDFKFTNHRLHFYGSPDTIYEEKAVRQVFRNYEASVHFKNAAKNKLDINFITQLKFDYFQEIYGKSNEWFIQGKVGLDKSFKKYHKAGGMFDVDYSSYKTTSSTLNRNLFFLNLFYQFNNDDWKANAGVTLGTDGSKFIPLPDLHLEKRLYKHYLIAQVGWNIRYQKNSFKSLATVNNFVRSDLQLENSTVSLLYGGFKGTISGFSYLLQFGYKDIRHMPFYYTDYFDTKRFYVAYDPKVKAFSGRIELGYNWEEQLKILLTTDINAYSLSANSRAWYEPMLKANLKASYSWEKKIIIGVDVFAFSSYYGYHPIFGEQKIKGTADVNLSVDYIFNKHFSFFGMLNNIAHQRYQKWVNYQVYGINGLVGAKFSF